MRHKARKWGSCLQASKRKRRSPMRNPCFYIHYNSRSESRNFTRDEELAYALVATVQAKNLPDLYDQTVKKYATRLKQLTPVLELPLRI